MDFEQRLSELLDRFNITDPDDTVELQPFFKWRTQVLWLLHERLGSRNPFTDEFEYSVEREMDPHKRVPQIFVGKGILEGLLEEFRKGHIRPRASEWE
jgi:hypothetical protein